MQYKFDNAPDVRGKPKHLHQLSVDGIAWKPLTGTSEVLRVISKPALIPWAVGEGLKLLGWTPIKEYINGKPRTVKKDLRIDAAYKGWIKVKEDVEFTDSDGEEDIQEAENWLEKLDEAYYAHDTKKNTAAKGGKDLHSELEKYVKFSIEKNEGSPANVKKESIQQFIDWACDNVDKFLWSEMHTYSEKYWLGGITDCGALLKDGKTAIIDFKSSKAAYADQFYQIAGYAIELEENGGYTSGGEKILDSVGVNTYIIVPFGAPTFEPKIINDEKGSVREAFLAALTLYRSNQNFE